MALPDGDIPDGSDPSDSDPRVSKILAGQSAEARATPSTTNWRDQAALTLDDSSGIVTTFADPADIARYQEAIARGESEEDALKVGDNGVGSSDLGNVNTTKAYGVAVPRSVLQRYFGNDPAAWRKARAMINMDGQTVIAPVVDEGPGEGPQSRGVIADITNDLARALGSDGYRDADVSLLANAGPDYVTERDSWNAEQDRIRKQFYGENTWTEQATRQVGPHTQSDSDWRNQVVTQDKPKPTGTWRDSVTVTGSKTKGIDLGKWLTGIWDVAKAGIAGASVGKMVAQLHDKPLPSDPYEKRIQEIQVDPNLNDQQKAENIQATREEQAREKAKIQASLPQAQKELKDAQETLKRNHPDQAQRLIGSVLPYTQFGFTGPMGPFLAAQYAASEQYNETLTDAATKYKKLNPKASDEEVTQHAVNAAAEAARGSGGAMLALSMVPEIKLAGPIIGRIAAKVGIGAATMEIANTAAQVDKNAAMSQYVDKKQDMLEGLRDLDFHISNLVSGGVLTAGPAIAGEIFKPSIKPVQDRIAEATKIQDQIATAPVEPHPEAPTAAVDENGEAVESPTREPEPEKVQPPTEPEAATPASGGEKPTVVPAKPEEKPERGEVPLTDRGTTPEKEFDELSVTEQRAVVEDWAQRFQAVFPAFQKFFDALGVRGRNVAGMDEGVFGISADERGNITFNINPHRVARDWHNTQYLYGVDWKAPGFLENAIAHELIHAAWMDTEKTRWLRNPTKDFSQHLKDRTGYIEATLRGAAERARTNGNFELADILEKGYAAGPDIYTGGKGSEMKPLQRMAEVLRQLTELRINGRLTEDTLRPLYDRLIRFTGQMYEAARARLVQLGQALTGRPSGTASLRQALDAIEERLIDIEYLQGPDPDWSVPETEEEIPPTEQEQEEQRRQAIAEANEAARQPSEVQTSLLDRVQASGGLPTPKRLAQMAEAGETLTGEMRRVYDAWKALDKDAKAWLRKQGIMPTKLFRADALPLDEMRGNIAQHPGFKYDQVHELLSDVEQAIASARQRQHKLGERFDFTPREIEDMRSTLGLYDDTPQNRARATIALRQEERSGLEKPQTAAVRGSKGVVSAQNHFEAKQKYKEQFGEDPGNDVGYVTNKGRFVTGEEAANIRKGSTERFEFPMPERQIKKTLANLEMDDTPENREWLMRSIEEEDARMQGAVNPNPPELKPQEQYVRSKEWHIEQREERYDQEHFGFPGEQLIMPNRDVIASSTHARELIERMDEWRQALGERMGKYSNLIQLYRVLKRRNPNFDKEMDYIGQYYDENSRYPPATSPEAKAWMKAANQGLFKEIGDDAKRAGMLVYQKNGTKRPFKGAPAGVLPLRRRMRPDVQEVLGGKVTNKDTVPLSRSDLTPKAQKLYDEGHAKIDKNTGKPIFETPEDLYNWATNYRGENRNPEGAVIGSLERARELKYPSFFYTYSPQAMLDTLFRQIHEISRIEAYGQKLPGMKDRFDKLIDRINADKSLDPHVRERQIDAINQFKDAVYGRIKTGAGQRFWGGLTSRLAASPYTSAKIGVSLPFMGAPYVGALRELRGLARYFFQHPEAVQDLRDNALKADPSINIYDDPYTTRKLHQKITRLFSGELRVALHGLMYDMGRAATYHAARLKLEEIIKTFQRDPFLQSAKAREFRDFVRAAGYKETVFQQPNIPEEIKRSFAREVVNDVQTAYRHEDYPGWWNTPTGRVMVRFGHWSYNAARVLGQYLLMPMARAMRAGDWTLAARYLGQTFGVFAASVIGSSEAVRGVQGLFGRQSHTATVGEIMKNLAENYPEAFHMMWNRLYQDIIGAPVIGIWGDLTQTFSGIMRGEIDTTHTFNPFMPPTIALLGGVAQMLSTYVKQGENLSERQKAWFAGQWATLFKGYYDLAETLGGKAGIQLPGHSEAEGHREWSFVRDRVDLFFELHPETPGKPSKGFSGGTRHTPYLQNIEEALLSGNVQRAKDEVHKYHVEQKLTDKQLKASVEASVSDHRPIPPGKTGQYFWKWARQALPKDELDRILKIEKRYIDTAHEAGIPVKQ